MTNSQILTYCLLTCEVNKHEGGWFADTGQPCWTVRVFDKEGKRIFFQYSKDDDDLKFYRGHVTVPTPFGISSSEIKDLHGFSDIAKILNIGK